MRHYFDPERPVESGRHNLPHWQQGEVPIFITYHLADSLPQSKLDEWKRGKKQFHLDHPEPWDDATHLSYHQKFTAEMEEWLDRGHGDCQLRIPAIRKIVVDSLEHFDGERYRLHAYVVMPNHVHLLLTLIAPHKLPDVLHSLKSFTSGVINQAINRKDAFWMRDYFDRLIRSDQHLYWVERYIEKNPEKFPIGSFSLWKE